MKNLSLNTYMQLCLSFQDNPTQENEEQIKKFIAKLQVREYMPFKEKMVHAGAVLVNMRDDFDAFGAAAMIEICKVAHCLLHYAINLDIDIDNLIETYTGYDLCMQYGLIDKILEGCYKDYNRFSSMIDNMINVSNAYRLIQTASLINDTEYYKWVAMLQELKDTFTPEMLKSLEKVRLGTNDIPEALVEIMANASVNGDEKNVLDEEKKYQRILEDLKKNTGNKNGASN